MLTPNTSQIKTVRRNLPFSINLTQRRMWFADEGEGDGEGAKPESKPDAKPDPKMSDEELQKFKDKIAGNLRKEAKASVYKDLLTQLGADPNDEKAVDSLKARLAKVQEMEDAQKSAEQKLQEQLAKLEKERDEAKAERENTLTAWLAEKRDNGVKEALRDPKLHCKDPAKVFKLLKADHEAELKALLKDDGSMDADKLKALVDLGKKENPEYFTGGGPGIPSTTPGARPSALDDDKKARDASFLRSRRAT